MKKMRKLLALLLALVLTLGCLTAWAEDDAPDTPEPSRSAPAAGGVTVEAEKSGDKIDVTVTDSDAIQQTHNEQYNAGIDGVKVESTGTDASPVSVEIDGANEGLQGEVNAAFSEAGGNSADDLGSVTVNIGTDGKSNVTETVTGSDSGAYVSGIRVQKGDNVPAADVTVNAGDVTVTTEDNSGTMYVFGVRIDDNSGQSDTEVNVGKVTATTDKGEAKGISATVNNSGTNTVIAGQVEVSGGGTQTGGVWLRAADGANAKNTVTVGEADAGNGGDGDSQPDAIHVVGTGSNAYGVNSTANGGTNETTVNGAITAEGKKTYGVCSTANGGANETTVNGAITAKGTGYNTYGIFSEAKNGGVNETTVNGAITAEGNEFTLGMEAKDDGNGRDQNTITVIGGINAKGNGHTEGINVYGNASNTVIVQGAVNVTDVLAEYGGAWGVAVTGNAKVATGAISTTASAVSYGLYISSNTGKQTSVAVNGDVTAEADSKGYNNGATIVGSGESDLLVDGTLSSSDTAVNLGPSANSDNTTLTVWAVKENADGAAVQAKNDNADRTKAKALEEKINYIVKVAEAWKDVLTNAVITTANKNTVSVDWDTATITHGTTEDGGNYDYHTAVEGEDVTVDVSELNLSEGQVLDGVYYYCDDEDDSQNSGLVTEKVNGVFTLVMGKIGDLRGKMRLGLKTHCEHEYKVTRTKEPTCTADGTDLYKCKYCADQYEETVAKLGHDKVHHDGQAATCTEAGWNAYDTCSRCNYTTYEDIPALDHAPGEPETESAVAPSCTSKGSRVTVVKCTRCGEEIRRETEEIPVDPEAHASAVTVIENETEPNCTEAGSYDEVERCGDCNAELSRRTVETDPQGHVPGEAVKENEIAARPGKAGSYDEVVYCTVCGAELNREKKTVPALPGSEPEEEKEQPAKADGAEKAALVYVEAPELHGIKSAERPDMAGALGSIGGGIGSGAAVSVKIVDEEKLVPAEQLAAFDALGLSDRLGIAMALLGCGEGELSADGAALLAEIGEAIEAMSDDEKAERQAAIDRCFQPRLVVVDDAEHAGVGIELEIREGAELSYERYTFFEDEDGWKLFRIETGEYK